MSKINYICGCHDSECSNYGVMGYDTAYFGTEVPAFAHVLRMEAAGSS
jgi:hypothetical protein